jgi:hypothetical protein
MPRIRSVVIRTLLTATLLAGLYLIPVNVALNLPATQTWVNRLQPQALAVHWDRAWSWYPLRVEMRGLTADGQAAAAQWEVEAASGAASVALRPLLQGQLEVQGLALGDFRLHLRPLQRRGQDLAALKSFFPVIRGRDPEAIAVTEPHPSGPVAFAIEDLRLSGRHEVWVGHVRADLEGEARANVRIDAEAAQGDADLDLRLRTLRVAGEAGVSDAASARGRIIFGPLALSALDTATLLRALSIDADLDLPVHSLHFLNVLLKLDPPMLEGSGRVRGHLDLERGELRDDTDLTIEADRLRTGLGHFALAGNGTVHLRNDPRNDGDLSVRFDTVEVSLTDAGPAGRRGTMPIAGPTELLYRGHGINLTLDLTSNLGPHGQAADATRLILEIPEMTVPDISVYQRLLPARAGLTIRGGEGRLTGRAEVSRRALVLDFTLTSAAAELEHDRRRVAADLKLQVRAAGQSEPGKSATATLDVAGSALTLNGVRVYLPDQEEPLVWQAAFTVDDGHITAPITTAERTHGAMLSLAERIARHGFGNLLDQADGRLAAQLTVSRLNWIARLLGRPFDLGLTGSGEAALDLRLTHGWLAAGTSLTLRPRDLKASLLDHVIQGDGEVALRVLEGGRHPLIELDARFTNAQMRPQDGDRPELEQLNLGLRVRAQAPQTIGKHGAKLPGTTIVTLAIPSARVADMSVYNAYLPEHGPLQFLGGMAGVTGELMLKPGEATGELHLAAEGLRLKLPHEEVKGDLRLEVLIRDGDAAERRFDIAGSALLLDRVQLIGSTRSDTPADWRTRIVAERARVVWRKPLVLDLQAGITIKDSRPFLAALDNHRGEHPWIDQLLTVEDLAGRIELEMGPQGIRLPYAMLGSREISIGAKGLVSPTGPEGIVYARFHDLTGLLTHRDGDNRFELIDARGRFDAYFPRIVPAILVTKDGGPGKGGGAAGRHLPAQPGQGHSHRVERDQAPQRH